VNDRQDWPPAFELKVAARAQEAIFSVVGDAKWRTEGLADAERTGYRDGLPAGLCPHAQYTNIRVSSHIKAWLNETEDRSDRCPAVKKRN
jgi:hypothetical protein